MSYKASLSNNKLRRRHAFVRVPDELVEAEDYVVWIHHRVGHLGRRDDQECLFEIKSAPIPEPVPSPKEWHSWKLWRQSQPSASFPHHIQHVVDELCAFDAVSLRSIVVRASLPEHKVVWPGRVSEWSHTDAVHGSWLEIHEDRAGYVVVTGGFIAVHIGTCPLGRCRARQRSR